MPLYDYVCPCGYTSEELVKNAEEEVRCPECNCLMEKQDSAANIFTTIIPTYPGSSRHKAGHIHQHVNRPATKTQVGYGGSVSKDHPTGGGKPAG